MKRTALALTLILSLLVSVSTGTLLIQNEPKAFIVKAENSDSNTIIDGNTNANVTIQSPENRTYSETNVTLAFTIESDNVPIKNFNNTVFGVFFIHGCVFDFSTSKLVHRVSSEGLHKNFPNNVSIVLSGSGNRYVGNATLTDLSQGSHNVTVWIRAERFMMGGYDYVWSIFQTVSFTIDSIPPHITILAPENKAYNTSDVPLDFTVDEAVSQISYSLDGQENITAAGNMTLTGLSAGRHNVTVYATDDAENIGASETVYFSVEEPFPTTLIAVAVIIVTVIGVGLLVYFKKRKH
jgi:hypothetical protein